MTSDPTLARKVLSRSLKARSLCWERPRGGSSEDWEGESVPAPIPAAGGLLVSSGDPWVVEVSPQPLPSLRVASPHLHVRMHISPSYEDTWHFGRGPTLMT